MKFNPRKKPNKKTHPFSHHVWMMRGLDNMSPAERVLMNELADIAAFQHWLHKEQWWNIDDMRKFVKYVVKRMKRAEKQKRSGQA